MNNYLVTEDKQGVLTLFIEDGAGFFLYVKQFQDEGIFDLQRKLETLKSSNNIQESIKQWEVVRNPNDAFWNKYFYRGDLKIIFSKKKGIHQENLGESGKMIFN